MSKYLHHSGTEEAKPSTYLRGSTAVVVVPSLKSTLNALFIVLWFSVYTKKTAQLLHPLTSLHNTFHFSANLTDHPKRSAS
jgi:hypothetical protein